jgi:3,2-trans-enoyl-CoA isomerase
MDFVRWSVQDGIAEVRLDRGPVNAIEDRVVDELSACFRRITEDPEVRGTVLTGTGKFFSFGFDIPRFLGSSKEAFTAYLTAFTTLYQEMFSHPKPIVAALNGHAVAGGCMLATACDARIMARGKAKIGLNEIGFGSSVFAGSVAILAFWVGERRAQEILYGGRLYAAEEALGLGLADAVADEAEVLAKAHDLARTLAARDPAAFRSLKLLLRRPALEEMIAREPASIREFVEIWYSERTWKNLQAIQIRG